jgi:hypothetical protein
MTGELAGLHKDILCLEGAIVVSLETAFSVRPPPYARIFLGQGQNLP